MDEYPDIALTGTHDHSNLGDPQFTDHPKQHRLGLVRWKRANDGNRPIDGCGLVGDGPCVGGMFDDRGLAITSHTGFLSFRRANLVDSATGSDREQPASKVVLGTLKSRQARGDLNPHRRGEIFRLGHALATEVSEQEVVVCPPQVAERVGVTRPGAFDHLLHSL